MGIRAYATNTVTKVKIFNEDAPVAGTEYSVTLPDRTKEFKLASRKGGDIELRYDTADPEFWPVYCNTVYIDDQFYKAQTIYFKSTKTDDIIDIIAYYSI